MSEQKPRIGKKGAAREIAKKLSDLRKKPLSKKVFDVVQENYERNKNNKKVANPPGDLEV